MAKVFNVKLNQILDELTSILLKLLLICVAFLAPIHAIMATVWALVVIDLLTGLIAAYKQGKPITSSRLSHSIAKTLIYQFTIIVAFAVETYLTGHFIPVCKITSCLIGMVECLSILENLDQFTNNRFVKTLIRKLSNERNKNFPK